MARILVTGGTGYIGSHTTVELMQQGYDVTIVDNLSNSSLDMLDGITAIVGKKPDFANIDCGNFMDLDHVFKQFPDIVGVIHFAASKAVGESVEKPLLYYRNNLGSLVTLLEVMRLHEVKNIVFSSSCTVYGQPDEDHLPVDETAPIQKALSPYGNTKQINEEIINDEAHADKTLCATILRYFNPIGAHPSALIGELPNGVPQNLLPFITQTAIGMRPELKVFGDDSGIAREEPFLERGDDPVRHVLLDLVLGLHGEDIEASGREGCQLLLIGQHAVACHKEDFFRIRSRKDPGQKFFHALLHTGGPVVRIEAPA